MIFATLSRVLLVPVRYWFPRLAYQVVQYEAPAQAVRAVRGRVLEPSVLVETLMLIKFTKLIVVSSFYLPLRGFYQ